LPYVEVRFFEDERGRALVLEWLLDLRLHDPRAYAACRARLRLLKEFGHELRRPHCDDLRDGIYEPRIRIRRSQLRVLYFFHGRSAVVLTNAFSKEGRVAELDIARGLARKKIFEANLPGRTHEETWEDASDT